MAPELRSELIAQAKRLAEERDWFWREPVEITSSVHKGEPVWIVRTNVLMRSPSVSVIVRKSDRAVVHTGYLLR